MDPFRLARPWIAAAALGILLLSACHKKQDEAGAGKAEGTPVQVAHPARLDLVETIDLNANTIFLKKQTVRATFSGLVESIAKTMGDPVHEGDLLLLLKTREAAAGDSLARIPGLPASPHAVRILARANGILTALHFNTGDYVAEGEEIAVIANPASLRITLNVPFEYARAIDRHAPCEILLPDGGRLKASISRIIPSVDPVAQTQTFLLQLREPANLPENLNLSARVPLKTVRNAVVVPRSAILSDETLSRFWIMKMISETTAVRVDITQGLESGDQVQVVVPELRSKDAVIVNGAYGLPDTARVSLADPDHE